MKFWPFGNKLETRAESSYTDVLIAALLARAQGRSLEHTHGNGGLGSLRSG